MQKMHIDALAFTGHKGLMGPQGIGGFLITKEMAQQTEPLIVGGTGSISDREETPVSYTHLENHRSIERPCDAEMPDCQTVRRMSDSGDGIQSAAEI